jgi:hypothetical protein
MNFNAESLKQQIPFYLTAEDQRVLVRELKAIAAGGTVGYVLNAHQDSFREVMLQGDGWRGFQLFLFETGERLSRRGIVLSNSCDVDPENQRDVPSRVIFAPLVKLSAYEELLSKSGVGKERVKAKIESIKAQKTSNMFFMPTGGPLTEDYIVRFDDAHSMPVAVHKRSEEREKLFTLSNTGFYMLVFKLSVHFCRFQEKISRNSTAAIA